MVSVIRANLFCSARTLFVTQEVSVVYMAYISNNGFDKLIVSFLIVFFVPV